MNQAKESHAAKMRARNKPRKPIDTRSPRRGRQVRDWRKDREEYLRAKGGQ